MRKIFSKVYQGFWTGTIRDRRPTVRLVFLGLFSLCDEDGEVLGTDQFLAGFINVTVEAFKKAVEELGEPDPDSTSPEHEGRRIIRLGPNRLFVVNHEKYYEEGRPGKRDGERATPMTPAERQQKRRERLRNEAAGTSHVTSRHVTDKRKENKGKESSSLVREAHESLCEAFFAAYPKPLAEPGKRARDIGKAKARQTLLGLLKHGEDAAAVVAGALGYAEYINGKYADRGPYVKAAPAWLNGRLWEEYAPEPETPKGPDNAAAAKIAAKGRALPEPEEGEHFELRSVERPFMGGVRAFPMPFIPGTDYPFDRAAWQLARAQEMGDS